MDKLSLPLQFLLLVFWGWVNRHQADVIDYLRAHWEGMAAWPELRRRAADFFTVEVLTPAGLVRFHVLFVIKLKTRKVEIAGTTSAPREAWMTCPTKPWRSRKQIVKNLTDASDGFLLDMRYLILDRDSL